jgi:hypothetical protein
MKALRLIAAGVALAAAGCRREAPLARPVPAPEAPPAQPAADAAGQAGQAVFYQSDPPARVAGDGWLERETRKTEQIRSLRDYAAQAAPGDPFALSEERIKELEKLDGLVIH